MNWDELFIKQAMLIAEKSKDPSTKVGCVLVGKDNEVLSMGFNGFPRGVQEEFTVHHPIGNFAIREERKLLEKRWERPAKYAWIEHAERNAIYNAARNGIRLHGARAYINWEPQAVCSDCCRALIQSGIIEVIGPNIPFRGVTKSSGDLQDFKFGIAQKMAEEAGLRIRKVDWYA